MDNTYTEHDIREIIKARVEIAKSQTAAAAALGISAAYLSDILAGRRNISATLADVLGFNTQRVFTLKEPPK